MKEWHTTGSLQDSHLRAISEGVIHHGQALSRDKGGYSEPLACVLMENGMLLGGVTGRTEFQRLFVNYLWIDTLWRGQGLAAEALRRLEAAAMDRGCVDALIETLDDDIAQWYERCGYRLIAHLPEYCGPWSRHTFLKSLVPADIG
ncbi:GCN5 family acetyltransferase [Pseudomonas marginalis ICMP 9505]|nr:GCN5 family acetyltransferase [Pseudomonas marginalis ICMP 9505]